MSELIAGINNRISNIRKKVTDYPGNVKKNWTSSSAESIDIFKNGTIANSKVGQATSGNMIKFGFIRNLMNKMGVDIAENGTNVQLKVSKPLTGDQIEALQKTELPQNIIDELKQLKKGGTVNIANSSLDNLIKAKGGSVIDSLKQSGINLAKTEQGLELSGVYKEEQKALLQKAGLSEKAIESFAKDGKYLVAKGTEDSLIKAAGRNELSALTKAGVGVEQKVAYEIAEKEGTGLLGKFGAKLAKGLTKVPVVGTVISAAFELPALYKAYKNNDLGAQTVRSGLAIAGSVVGGALGACLGPAGMVVGAVVGDMACRWLGKKLVGEPKEETKVGQTANQTQVASTTTATPQTTTQGTTLPTTTTTDPVSGYMADLSFLYPNSNNTLNNNYGNAYNNPYTRPLY